MEKPIVDGSIGEKYQQKKRKKESYLGEEFFHVGQN
jgi:hypothetical protein